MNSSPVPSRLARLPIFYGWIIVAAAFVTMGVGVNARTAFSLLFPPILTSSAGIAAWSPACSRSASSSRRSSARSSDG